MSKRPKRWLAICYEQVANRYEVVQEVEFEFEAPALKYVRRFERECEKQNRDGYAMHKFIGRKKK